jgi:hypothetical protein
MGRGGGKWGGGGGKKSFTLINRGWGSKKFQCRERGGGGGPKKIFNLNTMSRVLISIITNTKKKTLKMPFPTI